MLVECVWYSVWKNVWCFGINDKRFSFCLFLNIFINTFYNLVKVFVTFMTIFVYQTPPIYCWNIEACFSNVDKKNTMTMVAPIWDFLTSKWMCQNWKTLTITSEVLIAILMCSKTAAHQHLSIILNSKPQPYNNKLHHSLTDSVRNILKTW